MTDRGWIGVDIDGTLAEYERTPEELWDGTKIGKPIPLMLARVKRWIGQGREVRIVTARVALNEGGDLHAAHSQAIANMIAVQDWLEAVGLPRLRVQAHKDYRMVELWDDRAVRVVENTGYVSSQQEYV